MPATDRTYAKPKFIDGPGNEVQTTQRTFGLKTIETPFGQVFALSDANESHRSDNYDSYCGEPVSFNDTQDLNSSYPSVLNYDDALMN